MQYIAIAVGGSIGAVMRYLVSGWGYALLGSNFPWGTLLVNILGAFLIGLLWQIFFTVPISPTMRNLIFTGGLGAFTTFSTFALESLNLIMDGEFGLGLLNVFASDLLGLTFVFLGVLLGRYVIVVLS